MPQPSAKDQVAQGLRQRRAWLSLLVTVQLWLFANGQAVLGREFPGPPSMVLFYLIFMMYPLIVDKELLDSLLKGTPAEYVLKFTLGYILGLTTYFAVFAVGLKAPAAPIAFSAVFPLMAAQMFFVAPAEELFFRGFLPRLYNPEGKSWRFYGSASMASAVWATSFTLADVATSASFSAFHYAAYGPNAWTAFAVAFVMSFVWLWASRRPVEWPFHVHGDRRPMGIALTIGWHFAFNMCAFGVFTGGVVFDS